MTTEYTNNGDMPLALAVWACDDQYDYVNDPDYISATTLLKPLREIILTRQNMTNDKVIDLMGLVQSRLGSSFHDAAEIAWNNPKARAKAGRILGMSNEMIQAIQINPTDAELQEAYDNDIPIIPVYMEQRVVKELNGFKIGGKYDLILNGRLSDYKSTGTFTYIKQSNRIKYAQQGSIYRWLNPDKITEDMMSINYLFTDWAAYKVNDPGYPPQRAMEQHIELFSYEDTEVALIERLEEIKHGVTLEEEELPQCTDIELWRDPPKYKYFANPEGKRATKNFDDEGLANAHLAKCGKGIVKIVPSLAKACNYCSARNLCSQADKLANSGQL